jgi:hypothetical protein
MYIFMLNLFMISRHQMSISIFNLFRDSRQQMNISVFNLLKGSRYHMHINLLSNPRLPTIGQIFLLAIAIINSPHYVGLVYGCLTSLPIFVQLFLVTAAIFIISHCLAVWFSDGGRHFQQLFSCFSNSTHYLSVLSMDVYRHFL